MWYVLGIGAGLVLGFVMILLGAGISKKNGAGILGEYDERQRNARNIAFKYGFFVLLIYNFIYGIFLENCQNHIFGPFTGNVLGICIALTVCLSYSIWNDAYIELGKRPRQCILMLGFLGGGNFILGFIRLVSGELLTDGKLNIYSTNLMLGSGLLICMMVLFCKMRNDKKEAE